MPSYEVSRSIVIDRSPQQVFDAIADYQTWTTWSPWLIAEPGCQVTVSSPPNAVGSSYAWEGRIVGAGRLEHQVLLPAEKIEDQLTFIKPFKSVCKTSFHFQPSGSGTRLTWKMNAAMPWFMFWMIPMLKTFIGMDYQRGLTMLKEWLETGTIQSKTNVIGIESIQPVRMAGVVGRSSVDEIGPAMEQTFASAEQKFSQLGLSTTGGKISVYTRFDIKKGTFDYISGFLVDQDLEIPPASELKIWSLPACQAFRVEHIGSYHHLGNGWSVANQLVRHQKLKQCKQGTFEIYRSTPPETAPSDLTTDIYLPLKN